MEVTMLVKWHKIDGDNSDHRSNNSSDISCAKDWENESDF